MSGIPVDLEKDRWPLHPKPSEWEDLEAWVRRIAELYGVSYDAFLLNALEHTGPGARDLDKAPATVFARLSAGTGIPVEQLRAMSYAPVTERLFDQTGELLATPEGRAKLDVLEAMGSRQRRRVSAVRGF